MLFFKSRGFGHLHIVSIMLFLLVTVCAGSLLSSASAASLQGTILENDSRTHKVMLVLANGTSKVLLVPTGASITIDARRVPLSEIKPGMDAQFDYSGTTVKSMQAFSTMHSGYATPGSSSMDMVGELLSVDRDTLKIRLDSGKESTIAYSAATMFTKQGARADKSRLAIGDRLKIVFASVGSTFAESVGIESATNTVAGIYKGKVEFFDKGNAGVAVSSLKKLVNGQWIDETTGLVKKFYFSNGKIAGFIGAVNVEQWKLPYYKGSDVYIIASDFYGKPTVSRMMFKNSSESVFSDKITEIDWFADIMELKNGRNIRFGDGTVFIKGGRIVDRTALNTDSDALVVTGGSGKDQTADIISIYDSGINDTSASQFALYAGNMQYVLPDRMTYDHFYYLEDNEWRSFSSEKDIYFDNDTKIYDEDAGKFITSREFFSGNYAYSSSRGESNYFSYICADNDRAVAILLRKKNDSILQQRVSQGVVSSLDTSNASVGAIAVVDGVTEWNESSNKWVARDGQLRVGIATAAIVRNGQAAACDAIKPGDYLFMVRDDFYVRMLVVR